MDQLIFYIAMIVGAGYLALRGIRALEVGQGRPAELEALTAELELLRDEQQVLGRQITALREGQEFVRLLRTPAEASSSMNDEPHTSP